MPDAAFLDAFLAALALKAGWNSALVAIGAGLLGAAGGAAGAFVFLRKRALVSDAATHATLPGVALAFMGMVALGYDGRWLPALLAGSAASAALGLVAVDWMTRRTRLTEDAAIGAVLSTFFGLGIVLLTIIQSLESGRAAGLDSFLLGSAAGMLESEARTIAVLALLTALAVWALRRPMTLVAFDAEYAATTGVDVRRVDLAMMGLALATTVIGLKIVGLILIVALLIVPPATARFWTDRVDRLILIAAAMGGASGFVGAALSAAGPALPTGPIIVLVAFSVFLVSMLLSPKRGLLAKAARRARLRRLAHRRQGLLALAHGEPIYDGLTLRILRRDGHIRRDGAATLDGRAAAARALRDEARWSLVRRTSENAALVERDDGLTPLDDLLTSDQLAALDRRIHRIEGIA